MNKLWIGRMLIVTLMICLLAWDGLSLVREHHLSLPETHKQVLLTGVLLWFIAVLSDKNNDDDWAGAL